jgi:RNA polymerase sigma factor (sigma-70 family)
MPASTMADHDLTDRELVVLARAGDRAAFGLLLERCQPMVVRAAARMVGQEDLARELAQEAMLQAFLSLAHLRDDVRFRSWLYGITLNVCRSFLREEGQAVLSVEAVAGGMAFDALPFSVHTPSPQEIAEERDMQVVVLAAVNALPPAEREATLLFYYEELSLAEVARALGISLVAVKGRLHKSRRHLHDNLQSLYGEWAQAIAGREMEKNMVKVTIADVVAQERKIEGLDKPHTYHIVILLDDTGRRILPIWVGPFEGESIAMGVRNHSVPRPMTYNFIASILAACGASLEDVRIETLKDDTFYAIAKIRNGSNVHEIDARPSDALALTVRTGSPIYVAEDVFAKAGEAIPAGASLPAGKGAEAMERKFAESYQTFRAGTKAARTPEELAAQREALLALLFGSS